MKIIDFPKRHYKADYKEAIDKQVKYFSKVNGVKSIYQIGGVSTPGVSDIDLIVVFKNDFKFKENPRIVNNATANYLFTHSLYGVSENDFNDSLKYTFFHNYVLLYGEHLDLKNNLSESDQLLLKKQIALEFLVKMYVNLGVQKSYKTIKLRSIFLHVKALLYDFEFLNINPEPLISLVNQGIDYRNSWFEENISKNDIELWFKSFFKTYEAFLEDLLKVNKFYATEIDFKVGPNIDITTSNNVKYKRNGFVFPDAFNLLDKKHIKLLNRLNSFHFTIPMHSDVPNIVLNYFDYAKKVNDYNKLYFPYFMPLISSLKMY